MLSAANKAGIRTAIGIGGDPLTFEDGGRISLVHDRHSDAYLSFLPGVEDGVLAGHAIDFRQPYGGPYGLAAYFLPNGVYNTGTHITISNKRVNAQGDIQGVGALADGSEPTMLAVSPDINGPAVGIEADGAMGVGKTNALALAIYDLGDSVGGATPYSSGYGRKRFAIGGRGQMFWGADLGVTPLTSSDIRLSRSGTGRLLFEGSLLQFGGTTSGDPALKKVSGSLAVVYADDSNYAPAAADSFLSGNVSSFLMGSNGLVEWSNSAYTPGGAKDLKLARSAASTLKVTNGSTGTGTIIAKLPTSSAGLETGTLWNNGGTPAIA